MPIIYLILILVSGMVLVSSFRRMLIAISLRRLCKKIGGDVSRRGIRSFPRFDGRYDGRETSIFFHIARTKKAHLIYLLFTIRVDLPFRLFLLRRDEFKYLEGSNITSEVGEPLEGLKDGFRAWSNNSGSATLLLDDMVLKEDIDSLCEFPSLLFGPDLIVVGKQYDGRKELFADKLLERLEVMSRVAEKAEVLCRR